jgi:DUF4097 and DUF4098 domain-containing protein YvlB
MVRHRILSILIPAAVLAALLAAPRAARADEWHKSYSVLGRADIRVTTNDGAVRVLPGESKQVTFRVETTGWTISDNEVRIIEHQNGDRLELEARVPNVRWSLGVNHRSLRIEVYMPRESDLNVRTGDGNVDVDGINGIVEVHTGDGHINVNGGKGEIRLNTGDGHIEATGLDGRLDASSGDGRIHVEGRFDMVNVRTNDGSVEARINAGSRMAAGWTFRTGDGSVTLRLPDNFAADLEAHTGDGRITMDFPILMSGTLGRSEVRGKMNGGGATLTVHTGDGSIHIQKY